MKRTLSALILVSVSAAAVGWGTLFSIRAFAQQATAQGIADSVLEQITAIESIKQSFTPAQQKINSSLVFATKAYNGDLVSPSGVDVTSVVDATVEGTVTSLDSTVAVDIYGNVSAALLDAIAAANGVVTAQSEQFGIVSASLPLSALETVAASPDVKSIQTAARAVVNVGALTSQGYISHKAKEVVLSGVSGAGVTVGVLSDSASLARVAALVASGDLPAGTQVLPGQAGPSNGTDEGTAMMEIVHDIAPGANLLFATAFTSVTSFANNILALRAAGAQVIVDDVSYPNEGAFQDGPIARAVNQVTASGAIYFSSSANSGNLTFGTSATWEGDFQSGGAVTGPIATAGETGLVHNFGSVASPQNYNVLVGGTDAITLMWSDPLGGSTNDYDIFLLNSAGTTLKRFSAAVQNGTQDPYEALGGTNCCVPGDRIVVVLFAGQNRALRVHARRGLLSIKTAGSTFGHNAGVNTVSTAATYWNSARTGTKPFTGAANPNEQFSSDGPRKIFFNPNGTPITPGNLLFSTNGGTTLQKPDIAAADGVSSKTPGFSPFFGTSAASPHAAGIAALVLSARPGWTPAQVLNAIKSTALDSMAPGVDRDSGAGIAMAWPAVQYALTH